MSVRTDPERRAAEEDLIATAAAVQNLLLAAHAKGLSAAWKTGKIVSSTEVKRFLGHRPERPHHRDGVSRCRRQGRVRAARPPRPKAPSPGSTKRRFRSSHDRQPDALLVAAFGRGLQITLNDPAGVSDAAARELTDVLLHAHERAAFVVLRASGADFITGRNNPRPPPGAPQPRRLGPPPLQRSDLQLLRLVSRVHGADRRRRAGPRARPRLFGLPRSATSRSRPTPRRFRSTR